MLAIFKIPPMSSKPNERILIVDDEAPIRALLNECLEGQGYRTVEASNADEALAVLSASAFDLVLSDVRMPGKSGLQLLETIAKSHDDTGVLLLTACEDVSLAVNAMKLGALDYVLKPFRLEEITATVRKALDRKHQEIIHRRYVLKLEEVIKKQTLELRQTFERLQHPSEGTLEALVTALDVREHETQAHSKRVSLFTLYLAQRMGVDPALLNDIGRGAMLHDIGKIGVSDNILMKPNRLTESEWKEMRKHPQIGYWILDGIQELKSASNIVLSHQEKYDGTGYPRRLKGEEIVLGARIFSVVDCFDAMTSDRPYRKATTYKAAREEIICCSGTQFDPLIVKYFLQIPPQKWQEIRQNAHREIMQMSKKLI